MSLEEVQRQLSELVISMYMEKILHVQFQDLRDIQETEPGFVAEIINIYLKDTNSTLQEITNEMKNSPVDFARVNDYASKLKGSSLSLGARKVKDACVELLEAYACNNYDRYLMAIEKMNTDFKILEGKLKTVVELEVKIKELRGSIPETNTNMDSVDLNL